MVRTVQKLFYFVHDFGQCLLAWLGAHCSIPLPYFCALLGLRSPLQYTQAPQYAALKKKKKGKQRNRKKTHNQFHIALFKGHDKLWRMKRSPGYKTQAVNTDTCRQACCLSRPAARRACASGAGRGRPGPGGPAGQGKRLRGVAASEGPRFWPPVPPSLPAPGCRGRCAWRRARGSGGGARPVHGAERSRPAPGPAAGEAFSFRSRRPLPWITAAFAEQQMFASLDFPLLATLRRQGD